MDARLGSGACLGRLPHISLELLPSPTFPPTLNAVNTLYPFHNTIYNRNKERQQPEIVSKEEYC